MISKCVLPLSLQIKAHILERERKSHQKVVGVGTREQSVDRRRLEMAKLTASLVI